MGNLKIVLLAATLFTLAQSDGNLKRVCYYTNWSQYVEGMPFKPENIDPFLCTHIVYSFVNMENDLLELREWNGETLIASLQLLKQSNPDLKITVAIGGWTFGVEKFTKLVSSRDRMMAFATNAAVFVRRYGFDGLDLDWEYPGARGSPPEDKQRFVQLIEILQQVFVNEAASSGREKLLLTAAVPVGTKTIEAGYMIPEVCDGLDAVHLMAYDINGGGWQSETGHNAPLGGGENNVMKGVDDWLKGGCSPEKLIMGVPMYGRSFTLLNSANDGYGAPASNGKPGQYTKENGYLAYYEICNSVSQGKMIWNDEVQAPVLVVGDQWIGYDDPDSISKKVAFAKSKGLGGIMVWAIDIDDFMGICGQGPFPLLNAIRAALHGEEPVITPPTVRPTTTSTSRPTPPQQNDKCTDNNGNPISTNPFEIPGVCKHYQYCSSGFLLKGDCPDGTVFNGEQGFCDWPTNVPRCQGQTTTSAPVTMSTHNPTRPTVAPTRPTFRPTDSTHGPIHPTHGPIHPTAGPIHPTQGPIHPTPEPACLTNRDWQKAMKKWREDYADWKRIFDRWMDNRRN